MRLNSLWSGNKLSDAQLTNINASQLRKERQAVRKAKSVSEAMETLAIGRGQTSEQWKAIRNARIKSFQKEIGAHRARQASEKWDKGTSGQGFNYTKKDNPYVKGYELEDIKKFGTTIDYERTYLDEGADPEDVDASVNAYYNLWKSNNKKYSNLPGHVERTYGTRIRDLTREQNYPEGREKWKTGVGIIDKHPLLGGANALYASIFPGKKHPLHKILSEMVNYGRSEPPTGSLGSTKAKDPYGTEWGGKADIDWSKYKDQ